jgi:hypothetical protein
LKLVKMCDCENLGRALSNSALLGWVHGRLPDSGYKPLQISWSECHFYSS